MSFLLSEAELLKMVRMTFPKVIIEPVKEHQLELIPRRVIKMGMFDKDKVFAPDGQLEQMFNLGDEFVLWDCEIKEENFIFDQAAEDAKPGDGSAAMSHLVVSQVSSPDDKKTVSSLGGVIADKVREKEDGDLPAVVRLESVPASKSGYNEAKVLRFIEPYVISTKAKK